MKITNVQIPLNNIIDNNNTKVLDTVKGSAYNTKNYFYSSDYTSKLHYPSNYNNKIAFKGISFDFVRDNISFFENEEIRDILYKNKKHQMNRAEDYKPENLVSLCKGAKTKSDLAYLIGASGQEEDFNNKLINGLSLLSYSLYENKIEDYKEYAEKLMGYIPRDVKISTDQMLALFAFDVNDENDLKSYIDLIKKYPDLSGLEMILIRRMQLDDNAINTYINNIRNKSGLYKEEAVKCAKLGLTDAQVDRFIEIKNKKINDPDIDNSIPQRHCPEELKHIKYPVNRALKWAQEGKTDDEIEKEYKTIKLILKGYDIKIISKLINLNDSELAVYDKYREKGESYYYALDLCQLSEEERKIYDEYKEKGESSYYALDLCQLSEDELTRYNILRSQKLKRKDGSFYSLSHGEAYVLVKETTLSFLTPDQIKKLPEKVFYLISTGEAKDIHTAIQKAVSDYIKAEMLDNINGKSFAGLNFRNISKPSANGETSVYDTEELKITRIDNGIHVLKNGENNFEVNIKKKKENGKNVLFIEDKNNNEQFIAYNGAISIVDKTKPSKDLLDENTIKSFVSTPNLNPEKQAEILAKTAQNFVFNIIDDKNETIIGQGLNSCGELGKPFYCQGKSDDEIINHYGKLITELKQNNQLTAENILRIFPKDARLTIKPYSCGDDNKILYCIGAEWTNNNGKNWEMRIHSPQLNYTSNSDWIFRLGYQNPEKGNITFFEFNNTPQGYDFNGGFNEGKSHIHIPSPIRSNLLNNIDFQYIIKQISQKTAQENVTYETDTDKFMADYINNKDIVEKLRKENGLLPL